MSEIILNAEHTALGRLASYVAQQALAGNTVHVLNSEAIIITGNKKDIIRKYQTIRAKGGHSQKGPKYSTIPHFMVRRSIRGMLPDFRRGQGKQAFMRIKCHSGVPAEFAEKNVVTIPRSATHKYITIKELSSKL